MPTELADQNERIGKQIEPDATQQRFLPIALAAHYTDETSHDGITTNAARYCAANPGTVIKESRSLRGV